jgi:DNA (cytosine-5)-methyltransferase 1
MNGDGTASTEGGEGSLTARKPTIISLFAGCGGLDLGFVREGFTISFANDFDEEAITVYRRNAKLFDSPEEIVRGGDIWEFLRSGESFPEADVVVGGFPCQGFSLAGARRLDDSRNFLYQAMKETIRRVQPEIFVAENVRGLANISKGEVLRRVVSELESLGYHVQTHLVDAADYGVPQHRERLFIVGSRDSSQQLTMKPTHASPKRCNRYAPPTNGTGAHQLRLLGDELLRHATVRDAIGDLEEVRLGDFPDHTTGVQYADWYDEVIPHVGTGQRLYNFRHNPETVVHTWQIPGAHYGASATDEEINLLETLSRNRRLKRYKVEGFIDGSPMCADDLAAILGWDVARVAELMASLEGKGHIRERVPGKFDFRHGTYNQYQRLAWDEPARTLVTNVGNPRNMLHPVKHRAPSVRECARLMSFPDEFAFGDDISPEGKYRMLGNAVPPELARVIARAIRALLPMTDAAAMAAGVGTSGESEEP